MKLSEVFNESAKSNEVINRIVLERKRYIRQNMERQKFNDKDVNLIKDYCKTLKYNLSFNKELKTAKVYSQETNRYGFILKRNNKIWYGYKNKENGRMIFKKDITNSLKLFSFFKNVFNDAPKMPQLLKDFISASVGIIEIDPFIVGTENKLEPNI